MADDDIFYTKMEQRLSDLIDMLVPRGGVKPNGIYVSLEEYLSRLSSFNRKLIGVKYRKQCWNKTCTEHRAEFDEKIRKDFLQLSEQGRINTASFSIRSSSIENEFEMFLYSMSSSLSMLTRVIACFIQGSTQIHNHSKLPKVLRDHNDFHESLALVVAALDLWITEMIDRRDAATHYFTLGITSSLTKKKTDSSSISTVVTHIGIPKNPLKFNSLWDDELPTTGGAIHKAIIFDNGHEEHELLDSEGHLVVRRDSALPERLERIDGEKYIVELYNTFQDYIMSHLSLLVAKLR